MLKRAANFVVIAIFAAIFGFTGILHWTAMIAQSVCVLFLSFAVLSLLFSLFEEPAAPATRELRLSESPPVRTTRSVS